MPVLVEGELRRNQSAALQTAFDAAKNACERVPTRLHLDYSKGPVTHIRTKFDSLWSTFTKSDISNHEENTKVLNSLLAAHRAFEPFMDNLMAVDLFYNYSKAKKEVQEELEKEEEKKKEAERTKVNYLKDRMENLRNRFLACVQSQKSGDQVSKEDLKELETFLEAFVQDLYPIENSTKNSNYDATWKSYKVTLLILLISTLVL